MKSFSVTLVAAGAVIASSLVAVGAATATPARSKPSYNAPTYGNAQDVSCTSQAWCMAVGDLGSRDRDTPTAAIWNGHKWRSVPVPRPATAPRIAALEAVSCGAKTKCAAVGQVGNKVLAEVWNGTKWRRTKPALPAASARSELTDVSCPTSTMCVAVGYSAPRPNAQGKALVERWHKGKWSRMAAIAGTANYPRINLGGVSCTSDSNCLFVGGYGKDESGLNLPLAERWHKGRWSVIPAARQAHGTFWSIDCVSGSDCLAVGEYNYGQGAAGTLGQRWNGHRWTATKTPNGGTLAYAYLQNLSCADGSHCVAVGGNARGPFAATWRGKAWRLNKVAVPDKTNLGLEGISCTSSKAKFRCVAVGDYNRENSSSNKAVSEFWNGKRWTVRSMP